MNSFELNKLLGALLGTCLVLVAMHIAAGEIFTPEKPAKPGYEIAVKEEQPPAGGAPAAPAAVPIANLLASATPERRGGRRQAMPSLSQLPRGARTENRSGSLRHRRTQDCVRVGLQLFGRPEIQERHLGFRHAE